MNVFRTYLRVLAATLALGLGTVIAFDALMDPYGVTGMGLADTRPYASTQVRMLKAYGVMRLDANALALGNSRVDVGLDPESPWWPDAARPAYNLAIPGSDLYAARRYLQHAIAHNRPQIVVLGLDFMDFRAVPGEADDRDRPFESRLLVRNDGGRNRGTAWARASDWITATGSLDAFIDSVGTLMKQDHPNAANITQLGFNPLHEYRIHVRDVGHYALFRQRDLENLRAYYRRPWRLAGDDGKPSHAFVELETIIQICRNHNVRLILYIHPVHAHLNETIRIAGLWPTYEDWKRQLVRMVEHNNGQFQDREPISLWDFSGYNPITSESVPHKGDHRPMQWYWEAGHYKSSVGDLVLRTVFHPNAPHPYPGTSFGVSLEPENIERHLERIRVEGKMYRNEHINDVTELSALASRLRADERAGTTDEVRLSDTLDR